MGGAIEGVMQKLTVKKVKLKGSAEYKYKSTCREPADPGWQTPVRNGHGVMKKTAVASFDITVKVGVEITMEVKVLVTTEVVPLSIVYKGADNLKKYDEIDTKIGSELKFEYGIDASAGVVAIVGAGATVAGEFTLPNTDCPLSAGQEDVDNTEQE